MTPSSVHDIRNLALFGHTGSGKTTLIEALLAAAGEISTAGSVERLDEAIKQHFDQHVRRSTVHAGLNAHLPIG